MDDDEITSKLFDILGERTASERPIATSVSRAPPPIVPLDPSEVGKCHSDPVINFWRYHYGWPKFPPKADYVFLGEVVEIVASKMFPGEITRPSHFPGAIEKRWQEVTAEVARALAHGELAFIVWPGREVDGDPQWWGLNWEGHFNFCTIGYPGAPVFVEKTSLDTYLSGSHASTFDVTGGPSPDSSPAGPATPSYAYSNALRRPNPSDEFIVHCLRLMKSANEDVSSQSGYRTVARYLVQNMNGLPKGGNLEARAREQEIERLETWVKSELKTGSRWTTKIIPMWEDLNS